MRQVRLRTAISVYFTLLPYTLDNLKEDCAAANLTLVEASPIAEDNAS